MREKYVFKVTEFVKQHWKLWKSKYQTKNVVLSKYAVLKDFC